MVKTETGGLSPPIRDLSFEGHFEIILRGQTVGVKPVSKCYLRNISLLLQQTLHGGSTGALHILLAIASHHWSFVS